MSDTEIDQKPCDAGYEQCVEYRTRISDLFAKVTASTAREAALREALEFYADPENYHAIGFMADPPCGSFADDFDFDEEYGRHMPGKKAREILASMAVDEAHGVVTPEPATP